MIGIYKITNIQTGDFYIGQSVNIERRFIQHFNPSAKASHSPLFDEAIRSYGKQSFTLDVLEECDESILSERERYYIDSLNPPYNVVTRTRSSDFCLKVSQGTKKWWDSLPEEKQQRIIVENLTGPRIGHSVSSETREKISVSLSGRKQPRELVEKRRVAILDRHKSIPQTNEGHKKKCVLIGENGDCTEYESVKALASALGVEPGYLSKSLKVGRKVHGYVVRYVV